jgi:NAD(P)-dependent dehydrogenase (short-subunit alcohol dehydrogenase family)
MFDFANRVVVVTGAAGNLGQAVVDAFRVAGARLTLVDRAPDLPSGYSAPRNFARDVGLHVQFEREVGVRCQPRLYPTDASARLWKDH